MTLGIQFFFMSRSVKAVNLFFRAKLIFSVRVRDVVKVRFSNPWGPLTHRYHAFFCNFVVQPVSKKDKILK